MAAQASTIATGCDSVVSLRRCVTSYSERPRGIVLSLSKSGLTFSEHSGSGKTTLLQVGMADISFDTNPRALSDGYKRRLALAVQLVRMPDLLLDEPLAGLDWRARADVVRLLAGLKRERTVLVVSHDLKELTPLVDRA